MFDPSFLLIPAIASIGWALYEKYKQHKVADLVLLSISAVATIINVIIVYQMLLGQVDEQWHILQMIACSCILPLLYTYFARQVGSQRINNTATTVLWLLASLSFVPGIIVRNPFEPFILPEEGLMPFVVYVISHGEKLFAIYTSDLVVILQCIVIVLRIIPFVSTLRQHNLHLNRNIHALLACWVITIVFSIMISTMSGDELCSPIGSCFYFTVYTLILVLLNVLIAKGYDLHPIKTETGEAVEDLEIYVQRQYSEKATMLRRMMEEEKLFLDAQLTSEKTVELLGTNHTYFSKMMTNEWGMTFSEYVNSLRFKEVERLLADSSLTIATVAAQSGFADAGYMTRKFKMKYGMTPSEWRKKLPSGTPPSQA